MLLYIGKYLSVSVGSCKFKLCSNVYFNVLILDAMPYKIVQTIEKGKSVLTAVPESWEQDGVLKWPKKVKEERLKVSEDSCPLDDWWKFNCIVKRKDIISYDAAQREINRMCMYSDTETCASDLENNIPAAQTKQNKKRAIIQTVPTPLEDFNDVALECSLVSYLIFMCFSELLIKL